MENTKDINKFAEATFRKNVSKNSKYGLVNPYVLEQYNNAVGKMDKYSQSIVEELEEEALVKGLAASLGSKVAFPIAAGMVGKDMFDGFNDASKQYPYKTTAWQKTAGMLDGLANTLSVGLVPKGYVANSISGSTKEQMIEGIRRQNQITEIASWKQ